MKILMVEWFQLMQELQQLYHHLLQMHQQIKFQFKVLQLLILILVIIWQLMMKWWELRLLRLVRTQFMSSVVFLDLKQLHIQSILLLKKLELNQLNLEDTQSFVLLDIHLNMLDMVLVTTQLHSLISKIEQSLLMKNS